MSGEQNTDEKPYAASPQKLDQARKKGELARSQDVSIAAGYGGFFLICAVFGQELLMDVHQQLATLLRRAEELSEGVFHGHSGTLTGTVLKSLVPILFPLFFGSFLVTLAIIIAQNTLIFTPAKLQLKLSRISIISNAKSKFGRNGLFEFAKSFSKLFIYSLCLFLFFRYHLLSILSSTNMEHQTSILLMMRLLTGLFGFVFIIAVFIGMIDFFWQRGEHLRKNRMSHKELTDELKQSEGDPAVKQERRMRGQKIASMRMLQDVPTADVVILNPSHFAVALKWSGLRGDAPVCVAKGTGEIAARIREIAQENGIPLHRDPPTARAIFAAIDIGQQISPDLYKAVAAAIRFAQEMRKRARNKH